MSLCPELSFCVALYLPIFCRETENCSSFNLGQAEVNVLNGRCCTNLMLIVIFFFNSGTGDKGITSAVVNSSTEPALDPLQTNKTLNKQGKRRRYHEFEPGLDAQKSCLLKSSQQLARSVHWQFMIVIKKRVSATAVF